MFRSRFEIYQSGVRIRRMIPKARARVPNAIKFPRDLENVVKTPKDPCVYQMASVASSVLLQSSCSYSRDETTQCPFSHDMRIQESDKCGSKMAQKIAKGLRLGKKAVNFT
ncbi:hypothetical protein PsorP6_018011 [Peronosclerospora sorghi]|uniref:Uncharacterized protein n=1 Tax=Peronosclerospora sorghi TaxID=230839 RepID=A0ACC0WDL1_9STRA|nr:hypothetical protein PsorP6_018011 [Peronosclerospora sorghi]